MQEQQKEDQGLSRIQTGEHFNKIFQDQQNNHCFQCAKKSKQWAQTKHAIFLCLTCAAQYKDALKNVNVKNIGLDLWLPEQIEILKIGGNTKFKKFLEIYGLNDKQSKIKLRSIAAQYYRRNLVAQISGKQIGQPPSVQQGIKPYVAQIPITEMTSQQILEQAKQKLTWVGQKTKEYGGKAIDKVHHKVTSGQLKEDVINVASKVGTTVSQTAKSAWSFISKQIDEITKSKVEIPKQAAQL